MKSIFLVKDKTKINEVYTSEIKMKLKNIASLDENSIYTKQFIKSNPLLFKNVKFIFSTWYMPTFTKSEIENYFPELKAIFYAAGSVKYFAKPFIDSNIKIFSAAIANSIPVAEYVVAQIILANKGYFQSQLEYKKGFYKYSYKRAYKYSKQKMGNYKTNIGIIGAGMIGSRVIELLKQYDLNVMVYDPFLEKEKANKLGCELVSLERVFSECSVISNHLPDNKSTKGMITYSLLSKMNYNATFINTGRGAQVIEKDLIRILKEKPNICALLDVTQHEPLYPFNSLYKLRNAFITPHIAGSIGNEQQRMGEFIVNAYNDFIKDEKSKFEVTEEMLINMA